MSELTDGRPKLRVAVEGCVSLLIFLLRLVIALVLNIL